MLLKEKSIDLNKEFSPSLNTKRFEKHEKPDESVLSHFIKVTTTETSRVREKYKVKLNVRYGGENDNQLLDIYFKDEEKDSPVFVFIHGGFWQALTKDSGGSFVEPLLECGYRVVVVDYNLCPKVTLEELTDQMWNFAKWLSNYAIDTNATKLSISGHSAGAHLSACLLSNQFLRLPAADRFASFYLISGVYDLRLLWNLPCVNPNNILGLYEKKAFELSPLLWSYSKELIEFCNKQHVKMHILVAEHDSETFIEQSRDFYEKLKSENWQETNLRMEMFTNYDHFNIIEDICVPYTQINTFILNNIKKEFDI